VIIHLTVVQYNYEAHNADNTRMLAIKLGEVYATSDFSAVRRWQ